MAGPLADAFFVIAVLATVVAHWFILRSTVRGMRIGGSARRGVWEWVWAFLPAISLVVLFAFTWRAMHPSTITLRLPSDRPPVGVRSS
jgi:heme/copper-type cytochrome/quinol oxidase subunit 2